MKKNLKKKLYIFSGLFFLLVIGIFLVEYFIISRPKELVDCSKPIDVFYLKPNEVQYASEILNNGVNRVIVHPEINKIHARTELLQCETLNLDDYLDLSFLYN